MLHIPFSSTPSHSFITPSQSSMDFSKKRKTEENGTQLPAFSAVVGDSSPPLNLTPDDARKIIETFTHDQLLDILQSAVVCHLDVLDAVRSIADHDTTQRKLFVRGLGFDTTTDRLRSVFASYGDIEEAIVIVDRATGKSKGFGFVTFKHIDGALLALKEPSKKIDGRIAVAQLAAMGASGPVANNSSTATSDVSSRKIYVGSVPAEMSSERLLGHFAGYGEIEEGPLGFDKHTGKSRGFCFIVFKTEEGARASLVDPIKNVDGHQLACKLAVDNKKGKTGATPTASAGVAQNQTGVPSNGTGDRTGMPPPSSMQASQYGVQGGLPSFGGFSGNLHGAPPIAHHQNNLNSPLPSSIGGQYSNSQFGGPVMGEYNGMNNAGSLYRLPPNSMGMPSAGFPESGPYGFPTQQHHQPSQVPRIPPGGMYPGMPPYF